MSKNNNNSYEAEKQDIIKIAEEHFGNDYLEQLEKLSQDNDQDDNMQNYSLIVNHKGAFYACEK
ncbi:MAG: hypothetical protein K8S16_04875 [Bacteroidales bacterium]|nr:hypothetical protein [Bacteroidales bacterium]